MTAGQLGGSSARRVGVSETPESRHISCGSSTLLKWMEGINLCWDAWRLLLLPESQEVGAKSYINVLFFSKILFIYF